MTMKNLIDIHVHIAAFPTQENGCFMSPAFQKSFLIKIVKWKLGLQGKDNAQINASYIDRLRKDLRESHYVESCVALALDGVYDESGQLDVNKTHMMVSNS